MKNLTLVMASLFSLLILSGCTLNRNCYITDTVELVMDTTLVHFESKNKNNILLLSKKNPRDSIILTNDYSIPRFFPAGKYKVISIDNPAIRKTILVNSGEVMVLDVFCKTPLRN